MAWYWPHKLWSRQGEGVAESDGHFSWDMLKGLFISTINGQPHKLIYSVSASMVPKTFFAREEHYNYFSL